MASSQARVASVEDELRQRTQEDDDIRRQLQELKVELDVSACCLFH